MITGNRDCLALYATYRDDASNKTLEEIGAHACDVANIVTHVVSDCGRVAWVVLRDILLNFTDEICADVGGLGVDASTDAPEERNA